MALKSKNKNKDVHNYIDNPRFPNYNALGKRGQCMLCDTLASATCIALNP